MSTLQSSRESHELVLDLDDDASTGMMLPLMPDDPSGSVVLGADVAVRFSPTKVDPYSGAEVARAGRGVSVAARTSDGTWRTLSHADIGLTFAPTFAAASYEVRLSRARLAELGFELDAGDTVRSRILLRSSDNSLIGWSDVVSVSVPAPTDPRSPTTPSQAGVPAIAPGHLRVVSYNVLHAGPDKNPPPFARTFRALKPDIVLVQEWEGTTAEAIAAWFNTYAAELGPWYALAGKGWGVAVISRHPLTRFGPEAVPRSTDAPPDESRRATDQLVRYVGAIASTPFGDVAVASVHLKCCGSIESREDRARIAEATVINNLTRTELALRSGSSNEPAVIVIGGDINLVGSRTPLDLLVSSLDFDGSDLLVARPTRLGDNTLVTWTDAESEFSPGRLDYLLFSDSTTESARAFVVDTADLSSTALETAGLQPDDSRASDHLPVVLDLKLR